ncbi:helix-turn-helix domain-containing protein [Chitinophaga costaii]|nr:AraC family transcriptional regulator [Chitinophaga costaii]
MKTNTAILEGICCHTCFTSYLMPLRSSEESIQRFTNVCKHYSDIQLLLKFIQQNLDEPFTVPQLAKQVYMSRRHFARMFKEITHQSVQDYIEGLRIMRVKDELINTQKTISDIALNAGFSNQAYFAIVFKKILGLPPSMYRRRHHLYAE